MSDVNELNKKTVEDFLHKYGKRGGKILSVAGKLQQFENAINTPVGQQLMADLMGLMDDRLSKVLDQTATPKETSEYTAYKELAERWARKISEYRKLVDVIKQV